MIHKASMWKPNNLPKNEREMISLLFDVTTVFHVMHYKLRYVFPMVVVFILSRAEIGLNDYREILSHFTSQKKLKKYQFFHPWNRIFETG